MIARAPFGRTGHESARTLFGAAALGKVSHADAERTLELLLEHGVNHIDTAASYGDSELRVASWLKRNPNTFFVATKTGKRDYKGAKEEIHRSLERLGVDSVDLIQLHNLVDVIEWEFALREDGALEAAVEARDEGLVRFIGVTGHDWPQIAKAVATGLFDTVLCWYNCAMKEPEETVFPEAVTHRAGVVIMNASRNDRLFGGPGAPPEEDFYRYVLSHSAVHLTIMGLRNVDRFRRIAPALSERVALTPDEKAALERYGAQMRAEGKLK